MAAKKIQYSVSMRPNPQHEDDPLKAYATIQLTGKYTLDDLDAETFRAYRQIFTNRNPLHPYAELDDAGEAVEEDAEAVEETVEAPEEVVEEAAEEAVEAVEEPAEAAEEAVEAVEETAEATEEAVEETAESAE